MADSVQGATVKISADPSQLVAGLTTAQSKLTAFTQTASTSMAGATTAMNGASGAAANLSNSTQQLGATMGATGSRREMSESLRLLASGASGTQGAFMALEVMLKTFGASMAGPVLIAMTAAVAIFGALIAATINYNTEQRKLNEQSEALSLPADKLKAYTTAMKDLAMSLLSVKLGFSNLTSSQVDLFAALGIDPKSADAAQKAIVAIENSAMEMPDKIKALATLQDISPTQALDKLNKDLEESKKSANGWLTDMMDIMAKADEGFGGSADTDMPKTKGEANGLKPGSGNADTTAIKTQKQIEQEQAYQEQMDALQNQWNNNRISMIQNEAQKEIEQGQQKYDELIQQKQRYLEQSKGKDSDEQRSDQSAKYDELANQAIVDAQTKATRMINEQRLADETSFQAMRVALIQAGADSAVKTEANAGDRIIAKAKEDVAKLQQQLNSDLAKLDAEALKDPSKQPAINDKKVTLTSDFNTSSSEITANAQIAANKANLEQQEKDNADFIAQEKDMDTIANSGKLSAAVTLSDKIAEEAASLQTKLQAIYDKDVQAQQDAFDKGTLSYEKMVANKETLAQKFSDDQTKITQNAAQKLSAEENKPLTSLLDTWGDTTKQMSNFAAQGLQTTAEDITQFLMTGKFNAAQFADAIVSDLIKIVIEKELAGIVGNLLGGGSSSSGVTGDYMMNGPSTGHAGGGAVQPGVPTWVGERGPEILTPSGTGTVATSSASMGVGANSTGSGGITVTINNTGTPQKAVSATPSQSPNQMVVNIVTADLNNGGPISAGILSMTGGRRAVNS